MQDKRIGYVNLVMIYPNNYGAYTLLESIEREACPEIDLAQTTVSDANYVLFFGHQTDPK